MRLDRRELISGAGALAAAGLIPGCAPDRSPAASGEGDAAAQRLLSEVAEELLAEYPENASALGLDKEARAPLKSRLTDRSLAGERRHTAATAERLAKLKAVDSAGLSPATAIDVDVVRTAHETALEGFGFPYGDVVVLSQEWSYRNSPYVVTQNTGSFVEIPDFLDTDHSIANGADADAYLARLEAYAEALDGETARLRRNEGLGVIAPDFLLDKALKQMTAARAAPAAEWTVAASIAKRGGRIAGDHPRRAERIVSDKVAPALDRQIAELTRHRARATDDAGAWKLPRGEEYYAWALRAATTSRLSPHEVHRQGGEQLAALQSQMDGLLRAQGLTKGTVGERMTALGKDPRNLFPNNDAGRAEILDYVNGRVADIRTRVPRAFATLVPGRLVVKRVPVEIEAGAAGGSASAGSMDGSIPGVYYINLHDTSTQPRHALASLTYHEAIPGHVWQGEYTYKLPLIRSLLAFNAYSEGWALYAEQLGDELGAYEGDPLGRLGYLQSIAFRACRLVVDTGLHAKRWTREQAIQWFATTNGSTLAEVSREVDRYCAWPGQACGYKIGHSEINRLRKKAQTALGGKYDLRHFNDAVVKTGGVPLTVLERAVDAHIVSRRG